MRVAAAGAAPTTTMHSSSSLRALLRLSPALNRSGAVSHQRRASAWLARDRARAAAAAAAAADSAAAAPPAAAAATPEPDLGLGPSSPAPPAPGPPLRTGAFQRLPMVSPASELLSAAARRAARTPASARLKNEAARAANRAARGLDTLMKELGAPLAAYGRGFPPPGALHPFERALLELTVGEAEYVRALARVDALRRATTAAAKAAAARASRAPSKREALAAGEGGAEAVRAAWARGAPAVDRLLALAAALRRLPVVDPAAPAAALVGAPNVGKSSLVQRVSSGMPEVRDYPFTTRSVKVGHFVVDGARHQVTDTPGLLRRPDAERNAMERLTLAALAHLPTAVLFVADLTGDCGMAVADQWAVRAELRARFPGKPWLDVLSKADLLGAAFEEADGRVAEAGRGGAGAGAAVESAADFAAALPGAVRVSAVTGDGLGDLKAGMLELFGGRAGAGGARAAWWGDGPEEAGEGADSFCGDGEGEEQPSGWSG